MRILCYQVGRIEETEPQRIYVGGRLKPAGVISRNGQMLIYVRAVKTLFEANEYTVYKLRAGEEVPYHASKFVGTVADEDEYGTLHVVHVFLHNTTVEARQAGRDVSLKAVAV